jgi:hypothetical protein
VVDRENGSEHIFCCTHPAGEGLAKVPGIGEVIDCHGVSTEAPNEISERTPRSN